VGYNCPNLIVSIHTEKENIAVRMSFSSFYCNAWCQNCYCDESLRMTVIISFPYFGIVIHREDERPNLKLVQN
jgi:hypothetical protein